jgi:hypothetical protein
VVVVVLLVDVVDVVDVLVEVVDVLELLVVVVVGGNVVLVVVVVLLLVVVVVGGTVVVVVVVGQHIFNCSLILTISSVIITNCSLRFVMFVVISSTSSITEHIIVSNLENIKFKPSQVFTSVQVSGGASYEMPLVPIIVVLFILGQIILMWL